MITISSALQSRLLSSLRQCARVAATIALLTAATGALAQQYKTPDEAAKALIDAAKAADRPALMRVLGPDSAEIVSSGDEVADASARKRVVEAYDTKHQVVMEGADKAVLVIGNEDWPFPVPIVKSGNKWFFDGKAGLQELLYRRIGANELDAIQVCHGYVEAQYEYAMQPREGYDVNQYAQRIVSTPGKQDGLAWQNADGTWGGPIGEKIAQTIEQGYTSSAEPYHGYFFKVLKGQGPDAPLGLMDFVVRDVMIGGFALVATPAEYGVTGVKTFIVSHDGVVYEKDFGPKTLDEFLKMERFNPDKSWSPVSDRDD